MLIYDETRGFQYKQKTKFIIHIAPSHNNSHLCELYIVSCAVSVNLVNMTLTP